MSYRATSWAYEQSLTGSKKFVLIVLADLADEADTCRPSQQNLADTTGLSVKTIERAISSLERLGLVSRTRLATPVGSSPRYRYRLNIGQAERAS